MDGADDPVGLVETLVFCLDGCGLLLIAEDFDDLLACQHLAAHLPYAADQGLGYGVAAAFEPEGALVVEVEDEGLLGERRLVFFSAVQWQVSGQNIAQQRV